MNFGRKKAKKVFEEIDYLVLASLKSVQVSTPRSSNLSNFYRVSSIMINIVSKCTDLMC